MNSKSSSSSFPSLLSSPLEFNKFFKIVINCIRLAGTSNFLLTIIIIVVGGGASFLGSELIAFSFPFLNYTLGFFLGGYRVDTIPGIEEGPIITIKEGLIIAEV